MNADMKMGFWTGVGFLAALLVWNIAASKIPALKQYSGS
jgi:hypothetical protein